MEIYEKNCEVIHSEALRNMNENTERAKEAYERTYAGIEEANARERCQELERRLKEGEIMETELAAKDLNMVVQSQNVKKSVIEAQKEGCDKIDMKQCKNKMEKAG